MERSNDLRVILCKNRKKIVDFRNSIFRLNIRISCGQIGMDPIFLKIQIDDDVWQNFLMIFQYRAFWLVLTSSRHIMGIYRVKKYPD